MFNIKNMAKTCALASGVMLAGCTNNDVYERAEQYLQDRPMSEFKAVTKNRDVTHHQAYRNTQSKLDSIAYRDVFTTTKAINDSSKVAEFNKIANKNRANDYNELDNILSDNTTVKEYNKIQSDAQGVFHRKFYTTEYMQYKADSIAYRKFFEKHNLLDSKTLKMFNKVSKQIRP